MKTILRHQHSKARLVTTSHLFQKQKQISQNVLINKTEAMIATQQRQQKEKYIIFRFYTLSCTALHTITTLCSLHSTSTFISISVSWASSHHPQIIALHYAILKQQLLLVA